jgi:hypothetical protein
MHKKKGITQKSHSQWICSHNTLNNRPRFFEIPPNKGEQLGNTEASLLAAFAHCNSSIC